MGKKLKEFYMHTVHFVLMGKGGVGKSTVSSTLAQYVGSLVRNLFCADTDPTNTTFAHYKALNVQHFMVCDDKMKIDGRKFDALINQIVAHDGDCVIDTGASSFLAFMNYLHEHQMLQLLESTGRRVIVHTPLVGDQAMPETIRGLQTILEFFDVPVLIWVNEYFGKVERDGVSFIETSIYKKAKDRIAGVVYLPLLDSDTTHQDVAIMNQQFLTFDEALASPQFGFASRHRLTLFRNGIFAQLPKFDL